MTIGFNRVSVGGASIELQLERGQGCEIREEYVSIMQLREVRRAKVSFHCSVTQLRYNHNGHSQCLSVCVSVSMCAVNKSWGETKARGISRRKAGRAGVLFNVVGLLSPLYRIHNTWLPHRSEGAVFSQRASDKSWKCAPLTMVVPKCHHPPRPRRKSRLIQSECRTYYQHNR